MNTALSIQWKKMKQIGHKDRGRRELPQRDLQVQRETDLRNKLKRSAATEGTGRQAGSVNEVDIIIFQVK